MANLRNLFKKQDPSRLDNMEISQLTGFLTNLFEKPPFLQQVKPKINESDFLTSAVQEILKYYASDSKFNFGILKKYALDPGFSDSDFFALYRKEKSYFDSEEKILNYMCARIAQELMYHNYFGGLYSKAIKGWSPEQIDNLMHGSEENLSATVKNQLKTLINEDSEMQSIFNTLCKIIKTVLTS